MTGFLDNQVIDFPCPKCGRKHPKTVGWLKANRQLVCSCGANITIDNSDFVAGVAGVDKAMDDLKRQLKNFGK